MSNEECSEKVDVLICEELNVRLKKLKELLKEDVIYSNTLKSLEEINYENEEASKKAAERIIEFLDHRHDEYVSKNIKKDDLKDELTFLKTNLLVDLSNKNLCDDNNVEQYGNKIKDAYKSLRNIEGVDSVIASEILHILFPNFFLIWDIELAKYIIGKPAEELNEDDYLCFLKIRCKCINQNEITQAYSEHTTSESKREEITLMKPIDKPNTGKSAEKNNLVTSSPVEEERRSTKYNYEEIHQDLDNHISLSDIIIMALSSEPNRLIIGIDSLIELVRKVYNELKERGFQVEDLKFVLLDDQLLRKRVRDSLEDLSKKQYIYIEGIRKEQFKLTNKGFEMALKLFKKFGIDFENFKMRIQRRRAKSQDEKENERRLNENIQ